MKLCYGCSSPNACERNGVCHQSQPQSDDRWERIAGEMLKKEHELRVQLTKDEAAFERIRSLLRGLPRSATAESIDRVCAERLGLAESEWPGEHGQFGVGA